MEPANSKIDNLIQPNPAMPGSVVLDLRAVGDIAIIDRAAQALERYGRHYPLAEVEKFLRPADITFGNMEMAICSDTQCQAYIPDVHPKFRSSPLTPEALKVAGFDVINLANNHMMDWGISGLRETLARLSDVGLPTIGAGETLKEARRPAIIERKGLRVAFLGYSASGAWDARPQDPGTAPIDRELILDDVQAIRSGADLVVVSLHMGAVSEYPMPEGRRLVHELVDNGVDLILGHGPHVMQGVELYKGKVIAYSLGNFIFDTRPGNVDFKQIVRDRLESIILDVALTPGGEFRISGIPVMISDTFQTIPSDVENAARQLAKLNTLSRNLQRMHGLALWEHVGALNVEHELRVLAFQARHVGLVFVLKHLTRIRWRHVRQVLGYLTLKAKRAFGFRRSDQVTL